MRFTWKGSWKKGEITIEAETLNELNDMIDSLSSLGEVEEVPTEVSHEEIPRLRAGLGCTNAIRRLLGGAWGRQPRSMNEIKDALETSALFFSKGTISATLTMMTKGGNVRRFKRGGVWVYVLR